jgi:hypothetical protein
MRLQGASDILLYRTNKIDKLVEKIEKQAKSCSSNISSV